MRSSPWGTKTAALATFRKVLELDPEDAQAHFNLGEMYYDAGDLPAAERECRAALRCDPGHAFACLTLGNIFLDQEQPREALHFFQEFLLREQSPAAKEIRDEVSAVVEGLKSEL